MFQHKALLVTVNRTALSSSLYEAARYAWKLDRKRAAQADLVLAVVQGVIVTAFVANTWLEATSENFPGREEVPGRWGFVGHEAPDEIARLYIGKRVPHEYRIPGAANPVKYTW